MKNRQGGDKVKVYPLGSKYNWLVFFTCIAGITGLCGWASFSWWVGLIIGLCLLGGFVVLVNRKFAGSRR